MRIILLVLIIGIGSCVSDKKPMWYTFKSDNNLALCGTSVFKNTWLNDTTLILSSFDKKEGELFSSDTFKILGQTWSYKLDSIYVNYFSPERFLNGDTIRKYSTLEDYYSFTYLHNSHVAYLPTNVEKLENKEKIYVYKRVEWGNDSFDNKFCDLAYFSPKLGFIKYYKFGCGYLYRVDL